MRKTDRTVRGVGGPGPGSQLGGSPWEGAAPEHQGPVSAPPAHTVRTRHEVAPAEVTGRGPGCPRRRLGHPSVTLTTSTEASGRLTAESVKPRTPRGGLGASVSTRRPQHKQQCIPARRVLGVGAAGPRLTHAPPSRVQRRPALAVLQAGVRQAAPEASPGAGQAPAKMHTTWLRG